jgi:DNA (cytosine-5)-methyltransferase 1
MKYLSVCSGVEAATVAWHPLGWNPVAFSEIEKFPSQVLAHHYPSVQNMGDMTKYKEWNIERPDLLVGGTPCQSFSVAGLRKGLDDPRGNLALIYCGILDYFRPRWFVWENVPGVLSSNGGRDFGSFLGALAQLGYGFAYRVLDAQWFGVAQRRRRVFVVGYLGDWRPPAAVLFERTSLCRNTAPSREKGQAVTGTVTSRSGPSGLGGIGTDEACGGFVQPIPYDFQQVTAPVNRQAREPGDPCHTLAKQNAHNAGIIQPIPLNSMTFGRENEKNTRQCIGIGEPGDPSPTLSKAHSHAVAFNIAPGKGELKDDIHVTDGNTTKTLDASGSNPAMHQGGSAIVQAIAPALTASNDPSRSPQSSEVTQQVAAVHAASMAVRRLTPVECERLQGFPDNYTNIRENCPDGPRYKAMGNSMAVPVMRWIGERIALCS